MASTLTPTSHSAVPGSTARWPLVAALLLIGGALALAVATYRPDLLPKGGESVAGRVATDVGQQAGDAVKTVAGLFGLRSPGERTAGALASLKQKRQPPLHERALAKVRRPVSPSAAIVAAPPIPAIVPVASYDAIAGPKPSVPAIPIALTASPGGIPVVFPFTPLPGGGGGGVIVPPPVTITSPPGTPSVPVTVITPGVPEPGSWALMLIGFVMIGGFVRRTIPVDET